MKKCVKYIHTRLYIFETLFSGKKTLYGMPSKEDNNLIILLLNSLIMIFTKEGYQMKEDNDVIETNDGEFIDMMKKLEKEAIERAEKEFKEEGIEIPKE